MKVFTSLKLIAILLLTSCFSSTNSRPVNTTEMSSVSNETFYQFKVKSITGEEIDFSKYKGKKVLIVNVASKCGFTGQYADLQNLSEHYTANLVVLGFPCDNFGNQEPGNENEISTFCKKNYGVTFQMFSKVDVKGSNQHPLYKWLSTKNMNGWNEEVPSWNFCKYLVNEKGELIKFYSSSVKPLSEEIVNELNK